VRVFTSKHEPIELAEKPFASGGEGAVFKVITAPHHLKDICVKLYHVKKIPSENEKVRQKEREDRILYMVKNPPSTIRGENFMMGWPLDWVTNQYGKFIGFVMPLAFPGSKELVNLTATTFSKKLGKEWQERYDRSLGKKALLSRLKLICNIAIPVHILHSTGKYVLKDFKPQNVLATADGRITICDMDSIQIADGGKLLFSGTAATPDYMPPEFYSKGIGKKTTDIISESWDTFALGVVFYQLLFGIHPYVVTPKVEQGDGANDISHNISSELFPFGANRNMIKIHPKLHDKFLALPVEFQNKFTRTFSNNPNNRPSANEWGQYIYKIVKGGEINNPPSSNMLEVVSSSYYGLTRVKNQNGLFGFIDSKYNLVIPCIWEYAGDFRCKRAYVKNDKGLFGYIDLTGNLVISCRFKHAEEFFNNGIAKVEDVQGDDYYIDINGQRLMDNNEGTDSENGNTKEGYSFWEFIRTVLLLPLYPLIFGGFIGFFVNKHESTELGFIYGGIVGILFDVLFIIGIVIDWFKNWFKRSS
jgi:serine/threonine protein kinase